jgi:hypothetical protein
MEFFKLLLSMLIAITLVLACSGCTVKIENVTLNKTRPAGGMPGNLPSYQNATRTLYVNNRIVGLIMTYQTNDSAKQVINFYKHEMQERGYNVTREFTSSDETGGLIIFTKDDNKVYVTVGQDSPHENTSIVIKAKYQA